jgi:hypothetical protein
MAPDSVRSRAKSAQADRENFATVHGEPDETVDSAKAEAAWTQVRHGTVSLREAMRTDLGLPGLADDDRHQGVE